MSFKRLHEAFRDTSELPIKIETIRDEILKLGIQDSIEIRAVDQDPSKIRGAFYQFTQPSGVYSSPEWVTIITYSSRMPLPWQRLVCCKELMHVFDKRMERTDKREGVSSLVDHLISPTISSHPTKLELKADIASSKDNIATYQGLAILFPDNAREKAISLLESGERNLQRVASKMALPEEFVELVLCESWIELRDSFLDL